MATKKTTALDLTGRVFGRLTAIQPTARRAGNNVVWHCRCVCGNDAFVSTGPIISGKTRSCGCLHNEAIVKHGAARRGAWTREYTIWKGMLRRCRNPRARHYDRYGGRGIRVCDRWGTFAAFRADMGPCPSGHTLERINNDGDYDISNVRWATQAEQTRNTSRTRLLTYQGVTLCLTDWATRIGVSFACLNHRLKRGLSVERALTTPRYGRHAATVSTIAPERVEP